MNNKLIVDQFSVYLMGDSNTPVYAELAYGQDQLNLVVNKLWKAYFPDKSENDKLELIKHVTFSEFYNSYCEYE